MMNSSYQDSYTKKSCMRPEKYRKTVQEALLMEVKDSLDKVYHTRMFGDYDPVRLVSELYRQSFERTLGSFLELASQKSRDGSFRYTPSASQANSGEFYIRISELAFKRGTLSAGILNGRGTIMLLGCLEKAAGQSEPSNEKQQILSGGASHDFQLSGVNSKLYTNSQAKSVVGLTLKASQTSSRWFTNIEKILESGVADGENSEAAALVQLFPFMTLHREKELLREYTDKLSRLDEAERRAKGNSQNQAENLSELMVIKAQQEVLTKAINRIKAVINKKRSMKVRFRSYLDQLSNLVKSFEAEMKTLYDSFDAVPEFTEEELLSEDETTPKETLPDEIPPNETPEEQVPEMDDVNDKAGR